MKTLRLVTAGMALAAFFALGALYPARALAVDLGTQPQIKADVVANAGGTVRLFHGGTEEAKKLFCKDEVVPIYRYDRTMQRKQVGKVKLGVFVGEQFIDGIVVEGEIRRGDMAIKGSAACLVVEPPGGQEK